MKTICSSCFMECGIETESGDFDAHGPGGTIVGDMGNLEISECCGQDVTEIDDDLHDYWLDLKKIAEEKDVEWLVSDSPEDHRDSFEDGISAEEELDNQIDAASSSM